MGAKNGVLRTRENNYMSLSCSGEMVIKNNIVQSSRWKGMPRAYGKDEWTKYYEKFKAGDEISEEIVNEIISYDGRNNIKSFFEQEETI